ncbi:MAG: TonB-dependent receptor [Solimonas sp.]
MTRRTLDDRNVRALRKTLLAVAVAAAFGGEACAADASATAATDVPAADAPAAATPADETPAEVIVTGFRGSLKKSRDLKRDAVGTQDSIVAEDMAQFPDQNLAESLQRVPGVTITRDGGEGRRISLRGLSSNFALVQLNGMEVLASVDTAMDSRSQGSRDRAFDFNLFASELFNRIDVKKSFAASQEEGGMAGNVDLLTSRPFDYQGFHAVGAVQTGANTLADELNGRGSFTISNTWERFGALLSATYGKSHTVEPGVDTYRWRKVADTSTSTYGDGVSDEDEAAIRAGEVRYPRASARIGTWYNDEERIGLNGALQWKGQSYDLALSLLHGELNNDRHEYHINPRGNTGDTAYGAGVTINSVTVVDDVFLGGDFSNTQIDVESRAHTIDTKYDQAVLDGRWFLDEHATLHGLVGYQQSKLNVDSTKVYTETRGDFSFDYSGDLMNPVVGYGQDMTDASQYWLEEIDLSSTVNKTENLSGKLDLEYAFRDDDKLLVGAAYKTLDNRTATVAVNDIGDNYDNGADYAAELDDRYFHTESGNKRLSFAVVDPLAVLRSDFVSEVNAADTAEALSAHARLGDATNGVKEKTLDAYAEYQWRRELAGLPLLGNVGLRWYRTDTVTDYVEDTTPEQLDRRYDGVLPAINLLFQPFGDVNLRLSWGKNLTRPSYSDLSGAPEISTDSGELEISGINPLLKPYKSDNLDLGAEWYYSDAGFIALGYFHKDLKDYIVERTSTMTFSETGLSSALLPDGYTADSEATVTRSENAESATLQGFELTLQRDFDFLPAPFDKLGTQANLAYTKGKLAYYVDGEKAGATDFPDMSPHSGSLTLYYETDRWGVRVSQTYRGEYVQLTSDGTDENYRGFKSSRFWDAHAFVQLTEALKMTFDGSNLSNQKDRQFSAVDGVERLYNSTESGATYYLGLSYQY